MPQIKSRFECRRGGEQTATGVRLWDTHVWCECLPPHPCAYTTRQNQEYVFPPNYSIFILETFQGERDPGAHSVTQSWCQVLYGHGCWSLAPAAQPWGTGQSILGEISPKQGCLDPPDAPELNRGAELCLASATRSAG